MQVRAIGLSAETEYQRAEQLEAHLRTLLKTKSPFSPEVRTCCHNLRDALVTVLFKDLDLAQSHDLEQTLWKKVFYSRIEDFRKRIRKYSASEPHQADGAQQVQRSLASLRSFLSEATGFYHQLIRRLRESFGQEGGRASRSIQRCLIFLGDLARYSEMHADNQACKDWGNAAAYYFEASRALPEAGNPHNQLAVLAFYTAHSELLVVYRYVRSLTTAQPFLTARDNLLLLYQKNRAKLVALDKPREAPQSAASAWHNFCLRFIRLHGMLYVRTEVEGVELELERLRQDWADVQEANYPVMAVDTHAAAAGGASPALQLLVVAMHAVHESVAASLSDSEETHSREKDVQPPVESVLCEKALMLLFNLLSWLLAAPPDAAPASVEARVGLACVFLEWYATVGSDPAWGLSTLLSAYVSGPTSPPAAAATWRAVATLASRCQVNTQARVGPYVGHSSLNLALPEDSELRGMHVLAAAHVALDFNEPASQEGAASEEIRREMRVAIAAGFVTELATSPPIAKAVAPREGFICKVGSTFKDIAMREPWPEPPSAGNKKRNAKAPHPADPPAPPVAEPQPVQNEEEDEGEIIVLQPGALRKHSSQKTLVNPTAADAPAQEPAAPTDADSKHVEAQHILEGLDASSAQQPPPADATCAAQYALPHMQGLPFDLGTGGSTFGAYQNFPANESSSLFTGGLFGNLSSPFSTPYDVPAISPAGVPPGFGFQASRQLAPNFPLGIPTNSPWGQLAAPAPSDPAVARAVALQLASRGSGIAHPISTADPRTGHGSSEPAPPQGGAGNHLPGGLPTKGPPPGFANRPSISAPSHVPTENEYAGAASLVGGFNSQAPPIPAASYSWLEAFAAPVLNQRTASGSGET